MNAFCVFLSFHFVWILINYLKGSVISRKYLMQFINPTIAASVCDISINTRLRTENKNENTNKNFWAKSDKRRGKDSSPLHFQCCGSCNKIPWIRFLTRSPSNNGIMMGPCPSVCPHVPPLVLLREFQVKLIPWHRYASPAVKTDICNCWSSADVLSSACRSLFLREKTAGEWSWPGISCTVASWLGMEECHFTWMILVSPSSWQIYFCLVLFDLSCKPLSEFIVDYNNHILFKHYIKFCIYLKRCSYKKDLSPPASFIWHTFLSMCLTMIFTVCLHAVS